MPESVELPPMPETRDGFEAWAKDHLGQGYSLEREDHTYSDKVTRWAFRAWKAGIAVERERCAKLVEREDRDIWLKTQHEFASHVAAAIRSQPPVG